MTLEQLSALRTLARSGFVSMPSKEPTSYRDAEAVTDANSELPELLKFLRFKNNQPRYRTNFCLSTRFCKVLSRVMHKTKLSMALLSNSLKSALSGSKITLSHFLTSQISAKPRCFRCMMHPGVPMLAVHAR